jgi:hypothetical protein
MGKDDWSRRDRDNERKPYDRQRNEYQRGRYDRQDDRRSSDGRGSRSSAESWNDQRQVRLWLSWNRVQRHTFLLRTVLRTELHRKWSQAVYQARSRDQEARVSVMKNLHSGARLIRTG